MDISENLIHSLTHSFISQPSTDANKMLMAGQEADHRMTSWQTESIFAKLSL